MRIRTTMRAEFGLLAFDGVALSASSSASLKALASFVLLYPTGEIHLFTGVHMGPVLVDLEPCDVAPERDDGEWEDIVEFTARRVPPVPVALHGETELPPTDAADLCPGDASFVGIRVSVTGRDRARDDVVSEPTEHYLVQVWPARTATDPVRIKGSSVMSGSSTVVAPQFSAQVLNEPTKIGPNVGRRTVTLFETNSDNRADELG